MRFWVLAVFILLGGCGSHDLDRIRPINVNYNSAFIPSVPHFENEGVIVVGVLHNSSHSVQFSFIQVDSVSLRQVGTMRWEWTNLNGTTSYHVFRMPAGTYGLSWVATTVPFLFVNASKAETIYRPYGNNMRLDKIDLVDAKLVDDAPRFTVNAGEVVYVGNLELDFAPNGVMVSHRQDEQAARAEFSGTADAREMTIRPWVRSADLKSRRAPMTLRNFTGQVRRGW